MRRIFILSVLRNVEDRYPVLGPTLRSPGLVLNYIEAVEATGFPLGDILLDTGYYDTEEVETPDSWRELVEDIEYSELENWCN